MLLRHLCPLGLMLLSLSACSATPEPSDDSSASGEAAYTGAVPKLVRSRGAPGMPAVWVQPASEGLVGQYGYCGATAAANLLRWYAREVSPRTAIDGGCWSYVGTRPGQLGSYMRHTYPELACTNGSFPAHGDSLAFLRRELEAGRPIVIELMVGPLDAHWVVVVGIRGSGADTKLLVMSDGHYDTVAWSDARTAWLDAWGGPNPYVRCEARSSLAALLRAE